MASSWCQGWLSSSHLPARAGGHKWHNRQLCTWSTGSYQWSTSGPGGRWCAHTLVKVPQHPGVCVCSVHLLAAKLGVRDFYLCHSCCQLAEGEQENLLQVNSVEAGKAVLCIAGQDSKFHWHQLHLTIETKCHLKSLQLTPVEVCHLQRGHIQEVIDPQVLGTCEG